RRHFVRTAAALLGGAGAQALLSTSVRAFDPKLDLRAGNWITPVRNQNTCNWCTAFAAVATIEGTYNKKYFTDGSKQLNLSEGQLFFAAGPKDKCETTHWWPEEALAYCAQVGLTREDDETGIPDRIIKIKSVSRLIHKDLKTTQNNMKKWLNDTGPVVAVMAEYSDFYQFKGGDTVYYPDVPYSGKPDPTPAWFVGGHVVSIVGYDDTVAKPYWICKNSYGKGWNNNPNPPLPPMAGYVNILQGGAADGDCYIDSIDVWGVSFG